MPLGYLQEPTPQTPPSASGQMRIGVKNTFIEVMPPVAEPTQRARTTPDATTTANCGYSSDSSWDNGASSSFDHQSQQQQQRRPQQQRQQQHSQQQTGMNQSPAAYIDPATGVLQNFGMPSLPVQIVYMAPGQEGYPNMQFVDPSTFANGSDGSMQPYDFSGAQGPCYAQFMPMMNAQFVPLMNPGQMPMMEVPASTNEQNGNINFENHQYHQGPMTQAHHNGNAKEKRPLGVNGKKQKEVQSTNLNQEGPKAVMVDLSKLRPVNKASGSQARPSSGWYRGY